MKKFDAEYRALNHRAWDLFDSILRVGSALDIAKDECKELFYLPVEVELERLEIKEKLERIYQYLELQLDELVVILKKAEI
jgi:hypothetical protein